MEKFKIPAENFDLELTMTCGQTFCWHRFDGKLYGEGEKRFYSFRNDEPVIVEQRDEGLFIETELSRDEVEEALGLHHSLEEVSSSFPDDGALETSLQEYWGLRVVQDEFFPCLISYLCSPQMRIPRIKQMHNKISENFGETKKINGHEMRKFPTPEQLSEASEQELRDLGLGYRAEYVVETTEIVNNGFDPGKVRKMDYEDAREKMKMLYGVGDKVADCVLLFSLGFDEAVPLDTWAIKALKEHYPEYHSEDYSEASRNLRNYFGRYAGHAQEYIFHAARNNVLEV